MPSAEEPLTRSVRVYSQVASSKCRLCLCRSYPQEKLVFVELYPGPRLEVYCEACYGQLREQALGDIRDLPAPEALGRRGVTVEVPAYVVKDNTAFRLYYPADDIDLGLLRQRRAQERNET
jgi:hypothetical protein